MRDVDRLRSVLRLYEGTHDFRAFGGQLEQNGRKRASSGTKIVDTVRTVYKVELVKEPTTRDDDRVFFGKDHDRDGGGGGGPSSPPTTIPRPPPRVGLVVGEEGYYRIDFSTWSGRLWSAGSVGSRKVGSSTCSGSIATTTMTVKGRRGRMTMRSSLGGWGGRTTLASPRLRRD
jgi:hypothetical protein